MKNIVAKNEVDEPNKITDYELRVIKIENEKLSENIDNVDQMDIKNTLLNNDKTPIYGFILVVISILILLLLTSCSKNVDFLQSSVVPAAHGYINVTTDNNKNYVIKIQVSDLADVGRLQPPKESYVVWTLTDEGNIENIGQLASSSSFFSSQMEATLTTVSSYKPKKVFITAENSINVQNPGSFVVLSTEEFK